MKYVALCSYLMVLVIFLIMYTKHVFSEVIIYALIIINYVTGFAKTDCITYHI